jgi:hypothetical protein
MGAPVRRLHGEINDLARGGPAQQIFDAVDTVRIVLEERISPAFLEKAFNVFVHTRAEAGNKATR